MSPVSQQVASIALQRPNSGRISRRYAIWATQQAAGHEPCFGTARRYTCAEVDCAFRAECLQLRASWRR
jgi:hypothetical protein